MPAVQSDLSELQNTFNASDALQSAFASPALTRAELEACVSALANAMKLHDVTRGFLELLARKRRLNLFSAIITTFEAVLARRNGELMAEAVSATPLSDAHQKTLSAALGQATSKTVRLRTRADASLIGGVVIELGGKRIDASIKGKLERLRTALAAPNI